MTPEEAVIHLRAEHVKADEPNICWDCEEPWPCPTVVVLDQLEAAEATIKAIKDDLLGELSLTDAAWRAAEADADRLAEALRPIRLSPHIHRSSSWEFVDAPDGDKTCCGDCGKPETDHPTYWPNFPGGDLTALGGVIRDALAAHDARRSAPQ